MKKKITIFVLFMHFFGIYLLQKSFITKKSSPVSIKTYTVQLQKPEIKKRVTSKKIVTKKRKKNLTPKKNRLTQIKKQLAQIKALDEVEDTDLFVPSLIQTKFEDTSKDSYKESLIALFAQKLILPSRGKVRVALTISANGTVTNCSIKDSQSKENEDYIKNQLQKLKLPCFNGDEKSYIICFSDV